jgi:hypothetical protein
MALADADYCFISVEVGAYGSSSDSNVFKNLKFEKLLETNKLNIPDPKVVLSDAERLSIPFVLVDDEAFALSEHVLLPYRSMCYCHIGACVTAISEHVLLPYRSMCYCHIPTNT